MAATINDKFNKAGDGNGSYPVLGKVSAARSSGDAILTCEDLTGWATDTAVHFSTYKLTADGAVDTSTQTDWKGIVSGNTITNLTRICGAADAGNAVGDIVELNPTLGWLSDLVSGILTSHNQNGSIKDSAVGSSAIADGAVTAAKIDGGAVTTAKLANNSVTSDKVDFTTLKTQISDGTGTTGTSVTINLPADIASYRYIMAEATYNQYDATYGTILIPVSELGKSYTITGQNMHSNAYPSDIWAISITTNSASIKFTHCTLARVSSNTAGNVVGYQDQSLKVGKVWALK